MVQKGTFEGIVEKIPYLKELGITAVELMPCQEYEELTATRLDYTGPVAAHAGDGAAKTGKGGAKKWKNVSTEGTRPTGKINYWGYTKAHHFAPKASLCRKKDRDPAGEFRTLVRELHKAGIEVITELFFDGSEDLLADNINYHRIEKLYVELYTDEKDFALEKKVETMLNNNGMVFSKDEDYIDTEQMHITVYTTSVDLEV